VPENVESWWRRRTWSKDAAIPYPIGTFRSAWEPYPVLIRQYHPDLNAEISLTQVPPGADVYLQWQCDAGHRFIATPQEQRNRPGRTRRRSAWCPECASLATGRQRPAARARSLPLPRDVVPGTAFVSAKAPKRASAAEARLRQLIAVRLEVDLTPNAVSTRRPFFDRFEVWPDIVIAELKVAIEYDTTGRDGLEHVGRRERSDQRKDRLLRAVGWEVVRVRCGKLHPLGPYDLSATSVSAALVGRLIDRLGEIRGDLIVRSYLTRGVDQNGRRREPQ
jgi:very-short-patch-repair endonuclease